MQYPPVTFGRWQLPQGVAAPRLPLLTSPGHAAAIAGYSKGERSGIDAAMADTHVFELGLSMTFARVPKP